MKTIGLIGGMSWESSIEYYRIINEETKRREGGHHSAKSVMVSVNFADIEALQHAGEWEALGEQMAAAAAQVEAGGGDCVILCTNTMHKLTPQIEAAINIPFIHIADPTAAAIKAAGIDRIGLLGTRFTMVEDFYRGRLVDKFGLDVIIPEGEDLEIVHQIIYDELVHGNIQATSKAAYLAVIERLIARGAQGIILGCTEIGLLVKDGDANVPFFDTTDIHARAGVSFALADG